MFILVFILCLTTTHELLKSRTVFIILFYVSISVASQNLFITIIIMNGWPRI